MVDKRTKQGKEFAKNLAFFKLLFWVVVIGGLVYAGVWVGEFVGLIEAGTLDAFMGDNR